MLSLPLVKALSNEKRLQILGWLKEPRKHFPTQVDGDLVRDGVCGVFIAQKLGVSQPTASEHLRVLVQAGLVRDTAAGTRRLYSVDPDGIAALRSYFDRFWTQALAAFAEAAERDPLEDPAR